jgi:hypothetical protein
MIRKSCALKKMSESKDEWAAALVRNSTALRKALSEEQMKRVNAERRMEDLEKEVQQLKAQIISDQMRFKSDKKALISNIQKSMLIESRSAVEDSISPKYFSEFDIEDIRRKLQRKLRISIKDVNETLFGSNQEIQILRLQNNMLAKNAAAHKSAYLSLKDQLEEDIRELTTLLIKKTSYFENVMCENQNLKQSIIDLNEKIIQLESIEKENFKCDEYKFLSSENEKLSFEIEILKEDLTSK